MAGKSKRGRHSFIQFYMDDWAGGTFRMPRLVRSVYFDVCFYNWDKAEPMPPAEAMLATADIPGQGDDILAALVDSGKLMRDDRGFYSPRAIETAEYAIAQWSARSRGGSARQGKSEEGQQQESSKTAEGEQEKEPAPKKPRRTYNSQSVADAWNEMAKANGLALVKKLTPERRGRLNARIEEHGEEAIIEAIKRVPDSKFLMGGGERGWKAHFDWLLQPSSCAKLIEGAYQEGAGRASGWREE